MVIHRKLENIRLDQVIRQILLQLDENCVSLIVGGTVRDAILNIEPKDVDIEVSCITYDQLGQFLSLYGQINFVGKAFGVIKFTPKGSDQTYDFSIPRRENKIGVKHQDFEIEFDSGMSIEEAASRRDFTFNSLAYDPINHIIYDYYGAVSDIENGIMRHTSEKFPEDSLRILRGMQFQARFGFKLHPNTASLMQNMLKSGEFELIPCERVFEEWIKWAEKGTRHDLIFQYMRESGLIDMYPSLKLLKETVQDSVYHPEGDVEIHTELCLKRIDQIIKEQDITGDEKVILVMAILFHDIAKPATTEEKMKRGRMTITSEGHEEMGGAMVLDLLPKMGFHERLIEPISKLVANHLAGVNISMINKPSGRAKAVKRLSRKLVPASIKQLLLIMDADTNGRGSDEIKQPTGAKEIQEIASQIDVVEKPYQHLIMGRHLIEAGLKPSRDFKIILDKAGEAQENGEFSNLSDGIKWLNKNLNELTCSTK